MGNKSCGLCSCECYFTEKIIQNSDSKLFPYVEKVWSIFPFFASLCLVQTVLQLSRKLLCFTEFLSLSPLCRETHAELFTHRAHNVGWWIWLAPSSAIQLVELLLRLTMLPYASEKKRVFFETFMFMAFAIIIKSIASNMHVEGDRQQPWVWVGEFHMEMFTERARHVEVKIKRVFFSTFKLLIHIILSFLPPYASIFTQITHVCH